MAWIIEPVSTLEFIYHKEIVLFIATSFYGRDLTADCISLLLKIPKIMLLFLHSHMKFIN